MDNVKYKTNKMAKNLLVYAKAPTVKTNIT